MGEVIGSSQRVKKSGAGLANDCSSKRESIGHLHIFLGLDARASWNFVLESLASSSVFLDGGKIRIWMGAQPLMLQCTLMQPTWELPAWNLMGDSLPVRKLGSQFSRVGVAFLFLCFKCVFFSGDSVYMVVLLEFSVPQRQGQCLIHFSIPGALASCSEVLNEFPDWNWSWAPYCSWHHSPTSFCY